MGSGLFNTIIIFYQWNEQLLSGSRHESRSLSQPSKPLASGNSPSASVQSGPSLSTHSSQCLGQKASM